MWTKERVWGLHHLGIPHTGSGKGWELHRPSLHTEKTEKPPCVCNVPVGLDPATQRDSHGRATAPHLGPGLKALVGYLQPMETPVSLATSVDALQVSGETMGNELLLAYLLLHPSDNTQGVQGYEVGRETRPASLAGH